jgi:hypothetical protein
MIEAIADTHALIWYLFKDSRLSNTARSQIEQATTVGNQIGFSSITLAEIVYLSERNRIPAETCGFKLPSALTGGAWTVEGWGRRGILRVLPMVEGVQLPGMVGPLPGVCAPPSVEVGLRKSSTDFCHCCLIWFKACSKFKSGLIALARFARKLASSR